MLFIAAKTCRGFSYMLTRALEAHPSTYETPWSLVLYADEVVPGHQLSFKSRRSAHSAHLHWRTVEDSYIRVIVSEVNQSITQSANRLIDRSIDRSMDRSNDRSIGVGSDHVVSGRIRWIALEMVSNRIGRRIGSGRIGSDRIGSDLVQAIRSGSDPISSDPTQSWLI